LGRADPQQQAAQSHVQQHSTPHPALSLEATVACMPHAAESVGGTQQRAMPPSARIRVGGWNVLLNPYGE
jgi:hypothetical protein